MNKDIDGYTKDDLQQWQLLPHRCGSRWTPDLPCPARSGEDQQPQAAALLCHLPPHALQGLELLMGLLQGQEKGLLLVEIV